jgi:hypothetical protein
MFSIKFVNNKEFMSWDDEYVFDGERWVSIKEYQELLELMNEDDTTKENNG